ncbi:MAG: TonB-dependent receptor [Pseudomonadales bacterium]|nr:TonB-dependent receptor [Pseudomonadales bacterium]
MSIKRQPTRYKVKLLSAAISVALLSPAGTILAQETEIQEVVVTGSFIRRSEGISAASPILQMSAADLEAEGTLNMGEVIQNLSFNYGSAVTSTIQGTSDITTSFNLRGLGASSTLQLVDGQRITTTNSNVLLPSIAIDRIDIVTDGAAALYGSSAVAGVVNMVPNKSYEGFKVEYFEEGDDRGDFRDNSVQMMAGAASPDGRLHVVVAGEFRNQSDLEWFERPSLALAGLTTSTTGNPGSFNVPRRDANGNLITGTAIRPDPNCGTTRDAPGSVDIHSPDGFLAIGRCNLEFGDTRSFRNPQNKTTLYGNVTYEVNEDLTLSGQFTYSRQAADGRVSTSNPGGRITELPVIRGELPGNPFRAVDANGNPLFALDANGDGIPDRDGNGQVILDPAGIAFNEDVTFAAWRPLGKSQTFPSILNSDGSLPFRTDTRNWRALAEAEFVVPRFREWRGRISLTVQEQNDFSRSDNFSLSAMQDGLNCDVINAPETCFNPFAPDRDSADPVFNTQEVADSLIARDVGPNEEELKTYEAVFNGPLFGLRLPGGEVNAAFGYQYREDEFSDEPPLFQLTGDIFIGTQSPQVTGERKINSFFAELALPVFNNLEFAGMNLGTMDVSLSVRNEDFSTGQVANTPKYGITYMPTDWLTLRATAGEAFIAPTLTQLNNPQTCGLTNVDDPFTVFSAFTGSCNQGNPSLVPETSRSKSIGFTILPIEGMNLTVSWAKVEFKDRIFNTTTTDILNTDFFNFQQATGFVPSGPLDNPPLSQLAAWVADPRSDKRIQRDPNNLEQIIRILQSVSNASTVDVEAIDLDLRYRFSIGNLGTFVASVQGTYTDKFETQESIIRPVEDRVGRLNALTGTAPAIPEWKANARLSWSRNNHSATIAVRYVDSVIFDANAFSFQRLLPLSNFRTLDEVPAWTDADASYTYRGLELFGSSSSFTIGSRNIFDREATKSGREAGVIGELQDPLGRVVYARVNVEF